MEGSVRRQLEADLKAAMRSGDTETRDTARYILAAIKNAEIDRRGALPLVEEEAVLRRLAKQLGDAIEQYRAGGREDLATREERQLAILQRYLPAALTDDELAALVGDVVREVGATGPKDMGKVMPILIERAAGRADGRQLSAAVRSALSSSP